MSSYNTTASRFFKNTEVIANLGRGRFSDVLCYRSTDASADFVAVKRFSLHQINSREIRVLQEQTVLAIISANKCSLCPYAVRLLETLKDESYLCLIMTAALGGSLHKHIQRCSEGGCLNVSIVRDYSAELVSALLHLRKHQCIHRDIKANNVLLDQRGHAVLCDFGSSKYLPPPDVLTSALSVDVLGNVIVAHPDADKSFPAQRTYTITGTPHAMAPEMAAATGHSFPVDWWALGVLIHEMLTGSAPSWKLPATNSRPSSGGGAAGSDVARIAQSTSCPLEPSVAARFSLAATAMERAKGREGRVAQSINPENPVNGAEAADACWDWRYTDGPNARCYKEGPLGRAAFDLVDSLLQVNPVRRAMGEEVLGHPFFTGVVWSDVHHGVSRSPWPDFDRRLGFMDLLETCDHCTASKGSVAGEQADDELTEEQQALFAGF